MKNENEQSNQEVFGRDRAQRGKEVPLQDQRGAAAKDASSPQTPSKLGWRFKDLTGKKFGLLTVSSFHSVNIHKKVVWKCQCECGSVSLATSGNLNRGLKSCGCWARTKPKDVPPPEEGCVNIPLTRGKWTVIDAADAKLVSRFTWRCSEDGYAISDMWIDGKKIAKRMHWLLVEVGEGQEVDHISRNRLDNRRSNLRVGTHRQNIWNSPSPKKNKFGLRGVKHTKNKKKFTAVIRNVGGKEHLGTFPTAELAHQAFCEAAKMLRGEFACTLDAKQLC